MKVKFKRLHPDAVIPTYAKSGDAGLDLTAVGAELETHYIKYLTGLAIDIPAGYVGLIFPRSSIYKYTLSLANAVGIIDSGYRGEISLIFKENPNLSQRYSLGDRVGQLVILPYPTIEPIESDTLSDTVRSTTGFGSSGT